MSAPLQTVRSRHPEKANKPDNPIRRKPAWIRVKAPVSPVYHETRKIVREFNLSTVCEEAACPMAALWQLPIVYVIENNQYGMGTSVGRASAQTELSRRGESMAVPGRQVDGMDVLAVRAAALEAVEFVRSGNGPLILEMRTYRYRGHSMSDPSKYRSKEEVNRMRAEHDPIDQVRARLLEQGITDSAALKAIDAKVKAIVSDAAEFATNSPEPDPEELYTDILLEASGT